MNKQTLKEILHEKKVQDSQNPEKLASTLKELGISVNSKKPASFLFIEDGIAYPVQPSVYKNINCDEISCNDLYAHFEDATIEYSQGELLTAVTSNAQYTFIFLQELNDGTLLGIGMFAQGLSGSPMRYTKSKCRKATEPEITSFTKICTEEGLNLEFLDGKVDVFKLRRFEQKYFYIAYHAKKSKLEVLSKYDEHTAQDTEAFKLGNYFKTAEEALASLKTCK